MDDSITKHYIMLNLMVYKLNCILSIVLNNKKVKHSNIGSLSINGKTQTDPQEIANAFNKYIQGLSME